MRTLASFFFFAVALSGSGQSFSVAKQTVQAPEMGAITCLVVRHADKDFLLVPPATWRMEVEAPENKIRFSSPDHGAVLLLAFSTNRALTTLSGTQALGLIAPEIQQPTNVEEFAAYSGDRQGKGVELSFTLRGHSRRCRAATVPINSGAVSFILTCGANELNFARDVFGGLLTSFQHRPGTANTDIGHDGGVARAPSKRRIDD